MIRIPFLRHGCKFSRECPHYKPGTLVCDSNIARAYKEDGTPASCYIRMQEQRRLASRTSRMSDPLDQVA